MIYSQCKQIMIKSYLEIFGKVLYDFVLQFLNSFLFDAAYNIHSNPFVRYTSVSVK